MALKEDLQGDSTKPDDVVSKLTEGKTAGISNIIWFVIFVVVLIIFIKWRQSHSSNANANSTAGQFNLPYLGGFPIDIVTTGPPGPPGKQGPPGKTGPTGPRGGSKPPGKKHKPPKGKKPPIKKKPKNPVPTPGRGPVGGGGPPVHNKVMFPGSHITNPVTPAVRSVSVAAVRPTTAKVGSTAQRANAKKGAPVHVRVPTREIAKGAHR